VSGRLTTHVLDTSAGRPAAGLALALYRLGEDGQRALLVEARTDADGRVGAPLLEGAALRPGVYELIFEVGEHFARQETTLVRSVAAGPPPSRPFLDQVPVRFGVADGGAHYHVPLLVTPWSYTTYRGS
jgi:5-hydroxyisourate hydrolase